EDGAHAARGRAADLRTLQRGHAFLEHADRGIGEARIDVALLLALEGELGFLGIVIDIAGCREDRLAGLAELRALESTAHQQRARAPFGLAIGRTARRFIGHHTFSRRGAAPSSPADNKKALASKGSGLVSATDLLAVYLTWSASRPASNPHDGTVLV